ncbi:hypothetical protein ACGFS9_03120 [Streptomyces sp. NPDC048566]|uniref:hypothetical protein n=1 Tax=Streptomyces sp. NPDC048566 TaxID=3365569 RepID=UPI003720F87A
MARWPLKRIGEMLIDGTWVPVPLRESTRVTISRGISSEAVKARPGSMSVRVNDPDALYSPRNPESRLYGKIGRNTSFRFRVGDVPETPDPVMTDAFDRTTSNGWGTSTSGTDWVIYDPAGTSPPASDYAVAAGAGTMTLAVGSSRYIVTDGLDLDDYEATFTIATDTLPQSPNAESGLTFTAVVRANAAATEFYTIDINLLTNTGLPDSAGLRVSIVGLRFYTGTDYAILAPFRQIPNLVYATDAPLRVRVRCEGGDMRMRVWSEGTTEPDHWHFQAYDDTYASGEFGFRAIVRAIDTPTPVTASFADLEIRPLAEAADTVRMTGETAGITPYQDESGRDAYVDLDVAGVLRRYDGPQKPVRSALRRHISIYGPLAYWTFEEGAQGDAYVAEYGEQSTVGPLAVTGLDFARDSTLVGSSALPLVQAGGTLRMTDIPGDNTGYWSLYFMAKFTSDGFPTDGAQHEILTFSTATATLRVLAQLSGGSHTIVLTGTDADGTSLGSASISHENLLAAGRLGLLDRWQQVKVYAQQSGANTTFTLALLDPDLRGLTANLAAAALDADHPRSIRTTFGSGVKGMGIGHLSVWGSAFVSAYTSVLSDTLRYAYELGAPGMPARDWLSVLSCDQAAALDIYGPAETALGPYSEDSYVSLVGYAAETDMGLLVEQRDRVALKYVSRARLYNAPVDLVLDYSSGQVFDPFQPKDDDKGLTNRITARRRGGSEATAELSEGSLSTQPPPDGIGVNESTADTIVYQDAQLPGQAAWRLHLATWDEMRVASLTLKMANPRMRDLIDTVLSLKEGSRIQVVNTPKRYGPDGFDLLVRGSKEVHAEGVFDITFNCTPYRPFQVAEVATVEDFEDTAYAVTATDGGTLPWARSQLHYNTGAWSLRSGAITNNQTSDWTVAIPAGSTEMRFWYWTSSEASGPGYEGDRLLVLVDDVQVLRAQGTTGWTQAIVDVTGAAAVIFRYTKDNSASSGEDAAHIDDLSFTGQAPCYVDSSGSQLAADATATATSLSVAITTGEPWITSTSHPAEFPFGIRVGGEVMTVTGISGTSSPQTFTVIRSVNRIVKDQTADTPVALAEPAYTSL